MKTIGLLGGMSWKSTVLYYEVINRAVSRELGELHSAEILLSSLDFHHMELLQSGNRWSEAASLLAARAQTLETAGAELLVLCTNTMHKVADEIEASVTIPLVHIADTTGREIQQAGFRRVGLVGTRFTMEERFYRDRLRDGFALDVLIPPAEDRKLVDDVIYAELCRGRIRNRSRDRYLGVIDGLVQRGCEGIVLGCTEIGLLVRASDVAVPLFDTAHLHAEEAARIAIS